MSRWWWFVLLIGVAVFYVLYFPLSSSQRGTPQTELIRDEPDVSMDTAVITQFAPQGAPEYQLQASNINYYKSKGLTLLTDPELTIYQQEQAPWLARSKQGYIRQKPTSQGRMEEIVFMRKDVQLARTSKGRDRIQLSSESMVVFPQRQYAQTDQTVTIDTIAGRTVAQSMTADLSKGKINLTSSRKNRVHSIVLPDQFK